VPPFVAQNRRRRAAPHDFEAIRVTLTCATVPRAAHRPPVSSQVSPWDRRHVLLGAPSRLLSGACEPMRLLLATLTAIALDGGLAEARAPGAAASLARCEATVGREGARFELGSARAMERCLQEMANAVMTKGLTPSAAASSAAPACARAFRRLGDSRGHGRSLGQRMTARIAARCDPVHHRVRHTIDDITGKAPGVVAQPIRTANIDMWCEQFGGDGSIDSVSEWIACLEHAHQNAAGVTVVAEFPRALEWLDLVVQAMGALGWAPDAVTAASAITTELRGGSQDGTPAIICSVPSSTCGNGAKETTEDCDGADLGGVTCQSLGFLGGTLACDGACRIDTSGCLTDLCGNGVRDGIESCDGADLGGATCASLGFGGGALACTPTCSLDPSGCTPRYPSTGQTTCWDTGGTVVPCSGTGQDGDVEAGSHLAYTDNGDGTITDDVTGLTWEKKSDDGSVHDKDTLYNWTNAYAVHLAALNGGGGFAGHTDWRLPNVKELQTIVHYENVNPSVATAFNAGCVASCSVLTCSCTSSSFYWTSTTSSSFPTYAWYVNFASGSVLNDAKTTGRFVRAVRGGSLSSN